MLETVRSLTQSIAVRQAHAPARLAAAPQRTLALEPLRQRNALLDALFYDVGKISLDESRRLAEPSVREGTILVVPPPGAGDIEIHADAEAFFATGGAGVSVLAVAGVGSSALGAAAYARNVAEALGRPVSAVVSGYGMADLLTEAMGGALLFGSLNSLRHAFEGLDQLGITLDASSGAALGGLEGIARRSLDTRTVIRLLADPRGRFNLVTGHSKGNLVISEALYALVDVEPVRMDEIAGQLAIVTLSAKIVMPPRFRRIIDVMGRLDWFGLMNSRLDLRTEVSVPGSWHHTNTELPMHLPVTRIFRDLAAAGRLGQTGPS